MGACHNTIAPEPWDAVEKTRGKPVEAIVAIAVIGGKRVRVRVFVFFKEATAATGAKGLGFLWSGRGFSSGKKGLGFFLVFFRGKGEAGEEEGGGGGGKEIDFTGRR
ncbi:hypothetical protein L6452_06355 [Arctium lappa]|uniref:Uncharacterized protein n=1 Tax=Arctium lappa TaxID=4217 RepID=A0ACB9EIB6_ARCLA|nr:hypothetical protein L6452_06355 [Arctium lappa]